MKIILITIFLLLIIFAIFYLNRCQESFDPNPGIPSRFYTKHKAMVTLPNRVRSQEEIPGSYLSIVDPYSLYLFKDISEKEAWWNKTHARKFYYYRDYVPPYYKE